MLRSAPLFLLLILLAAAPVRAEFDAPSTATVPSITVSGTATIYIEPDLVDVRFGVEVFNSELAAARTDHDERLRKILAAITEVGVDAKDVQTTHASVNPEYDRDQYGRFRYEQRIGFRVGKSIGVKLRDAKKLDALVNRVMDAGATTIDGVSFDHSGIAAHRETARLQAAKAAREKADSMARVLNSKIGRALRVLEQPQPVTYFPGNRYSNVAMDAGAGGGGEEASTFALGQMEVKATIDATFELTQ